MTRSIKAVFEGGVLKPSEPLDLAEGQWVNLTVGERTPVDDEIETLPKGSRERLIKRMESWEPLPQEWFDEMEAGIREADRPIDVNDLPDVGPTP